MDIIDQQLLLTKLTRDKSKFNPDHRSQGNSTRITSRPQELELSKPAHITWRTISYYVENQLILRRERTQSESDSRTGP